MEENEKLIKELKEQLEKLVDEIEEVNEQISDYKQEDWINKISVMDAKSLIYKTTIKHPTL